MRSPGPEIVLKAPHIIVTLPGPHRVLSWALVGGGLCQLSAVVWREVQNRDLGPGVCAQSLLQESLKAVGYPNATGLLTSAPLRDYCAVQETRDGHTAFALATVGLSNALAVGDPPNIKPRSFGTINLLAWFSHALSESATVEALSIAAEARTAAVLEAKVQSRVSEQFASGTGTDCIVVASPSGSNEHAYAGKHTNSGSLLGQTSLAAVRGGISKWRARSKSRV